MFVELVACAAPDTLAPEVGALDLPVVEGELLRLNDNVNVVTLAATGGPVAPSEVHPGVPWILAADRRRTWAEVCPALRAIQGPKVALAVATTGPGWWVVHSVDLRPESAGALTLAPGAGADALLELDRRLFGESNKQVGLVLARETSWQDVVATAAALLATRSGSASLPACPHD